MKTCETDIHPQIVYDSDSHGTCPLCAAHRYIDSLEVELKEARKLSGINYEVTCICSHPWTVEKTVNGMDINIRTDETLKPGQWYLEQGK